MRKEAYQIIILFSFLLMNTVAYSQDKNAIMMLSRTNGTDIKLRWAPSNSLVWELANKYGYTIERYTVTKYDNPQAPGDLNLITSPLLKPADEAVWEPLIDDDDNAAIVAQAIYGETFELTDSFDKDIFQIAQKTKERDQRFSFALFACDQSFQVAGLAGLAYTDEQARPSEKYLYKVYANIPSNILEVDTAIAFIGLDNEAPLPKINEFQATFGDKKVILSWNKTLTDRFYNAFIIEKSLDGGETFQSITERPIINAYSDGDAKTGTYYKPDSLSNNEDEVTYRIRGINPFGEQGPYSDVLTGKGKPTVDALAAITSHDLNKDGTATIYWEYPDNKEKLIEGFLLKVAPSAKGPFNDYSGALIERTQRTFRIPKPRGTGYYSLALVVDGQAMNFSIPYLVQLEDSIPPRPPRDVVASISPQGKVEMKWRQNLEDDFWGYRVYRSNFKSAEFSEITTDPIEQSVFTDSLALDNLTEKIYYKIFSVDTRDNRSEASEMIEIDKPDIVPPTSPLFKKAEGLETGVLLEWVPSSSKDVSTHHLYRSLPGTASWELIATVDSLNFFLDTLALEGKPSLYTAIAVDDAGLESEPAKPVRASRKPSVGKVAYQGFSGRSERDNKRIVLFWRLENEKIDEIKVYRAAGDEPMTLYQTIAKTDQFVDKQVAQNVKYSYQLKAVMKNNMEAGFSEMVEVIF